MDAESGSHNQDLMARLKTENDLLRSALDETECGRALLRQREEFSLMLDLSKNILAELDLEKVLQLVAGKARDIVNAELVLVPMLNEDRTRYAYLAASGLDADKALGVSLDAKVGMCGWVLRNERSLLFGEDSVNWMDKETAWEAGQQSAVLVPLFGRKRIIGGLSALGKNGGGSFSSHDLDILTMFANQISIAIENAMLFRQVNNQIDEGRRKELIIREREEWFRAIFNATNEAIFIHDMMTGDILDVNQRMCEMYGYARDEALSVDVAALSSGVPPYTQEGAMERIQLAAENSPQVFEWQAKDKDGRLFWVEVNSRKADIGTEKRLIVTVRDITERKGVEKEIAQYRERLEILVRERTAELEEKNLELQRMNKLFVGRELRMVELKERIRALEKK